MLSILLKPQHLTRNYILSTFNSYKRCGILKPSLPNLQAVSSSNDPCVCGGGGASGSDGSPSQTSGGGSKHKITYMPYKRPPPKQHDYKNMDLGRPMSPHLTIYAPTITAATSIFQRITGIILVTYTVLLSGGSLFLSNGVETYVSMIQSLDLSRFSILIIKLILGTPFAFHYSNGIRFCMWNAAKWMAMKEVFESARRCFIMTAVIVVLFALI